jgi:hypothetical protein
MAGYKLFFVSAQGKFWICSIVRTEKHIMDVTRMISARTITERLRCLLCSRASLLVEKPVRVLGKEIVARAKQVPSMFYPSLTPTPTKRRTALSQIQMERTR